MGVGLYIAFAPRMNTKSLRIPWLMGFAHLKERIHLRETLQTASHVMPWVKSGSKVLDIGCGTGEVTAMLSQLTGGNATGVDIVDRRGVGGFHFSLFDGENLPFPDRSFDLILFSFVLHHVPNEKKTALLHEAMRTTKDKVAIIEDTPTTYFDHWMGHLHAKAHRRKIQSNANFGFLTQQEWSWFFQGLGLTICEQKRIRRFSRSPTQPYARTGFILQVPGF